MPRTYKKRLNGRNYVNYSPEHLKKALDDVIEKKISLRKAAAQYGIPKSTIVQHAKKRKEANEEYHDDSFLQRKFGGPRAFSEEEEDIIAAHIIGIMTIGLPVTGKDLAIIVATYLQSIGRQVKQFASNNNTPGPDWVRCFLKRHKELSARMSKRISQDWASISKEFIENYFKSSLD